MDTARSIPTELEVKTAGDKGAGLFTRRQIAAGTEILSWRPFAIALDLPHLHQLCSNCLTGGQGELGANDGRHLKSCLGCKSTKYCSTFCQKQHWHFSHKYECNSFADFDIDELSTSARLLVQILLRRKHHLLSDESWTALLNLASHCTQFQISSNETYSKSWHNIEAVTREVSEILGEAYDTSLIKSLVGRIFVNGHTLTHSTLEPLGVCLDPRTAIVNHSCDPNVHIIFDGNQLSVRSLRELRAGDELLISYIDPTDMRDKRCFELNARYHFLCNCINCTSQGAKDLHDNATSRPSKESIYQAYDLKRQLPLLESSADAKMQYAKALVALGDYPHSLQPYPAILHDYYLILLARQEWVPALLVLLERFFYIDPVLYPLPWHPLRVVHSWVLTRLMSHVKTLLDEGDGTARALRKSPEFWSVCIAALHTQVVSAVEKSHGLNNSLTREIHQAPLNYGWHMPSSPESDASAKLESLKTLLQRSRGQLG